MNDKIAGDILKIAKSLISANGRTTRVSVYTGQYSDSSGDMHVLLKFEVTPLGVDAYATVDAWNSRPDKYEVTDRELKHILGGKPFDKRKVDQYAKAYYDIVK